MMRRRDLESAIIFFSIALTNHYYTCMSLKHLYPVHRLIQSGRAARYFSISTALGSGHSRWSKIKHDKGKADALKGDARSDIARQIVRASKGKLTGP